MDVIGDRSKVQCCKEQYCIGTWNVRFLNQGKLEVVKQEMARVNIDILEISELKWTGMGEFNSDDHYIYYSGQESLRRNGIAIIVNKSLKCSTWMQSQKRQNDLCSFPRQTIQYHSSDNSHMVSEQPSISSRSLARMSGQPHPRRLPESGYPHVLLIIIASWI